MIDRSLPIGTIFPAQEKKTDVSECGRCGHDAKDHVPWHPENCAHVTRRKRGRGYIVCQCPAFTPKKEDRK